MFSKRLSGVEGPSYGVSAFAGPPFRGRRTHRTDETAFSWRDWKTGGRDSRMMNDFWPELQKSFGSMLDSFSSPILILEKISFPCWYLPCSNPILTYTILPNNLLVSIFQYSSPMLIYFHLYSKQIHHSQYSSNSKQSRASFVRGQGETVVKHATVII